MIESSSRALAGAAALVALMIGLAAAAPAQATVPGVNGKISYLEWQPGFTRNLVSIDADGAGRTSPFQTGSQPGLSVSPLGRFVFIQGWGQLVSRSPADGAPFVIVDHVHGDFDERKFDPDWSPDGTRIAFAQKAAEWTTDLHVVGAAGGPVSQLTALELPEDISAAADVLRLSWSPDGDEVAYYVRSDNTEAPESVNEVRVIRADGMNDRRVLSFGPSPYLTGLDWSPDGDRLALASSGSSAGPQLETVRVDGSDRRMLGSGAGTDATDVEWSPDGRQVAFRRYLNNLEIGEVAIMNADGSGLRAVPDTRGAEYGSLAWQALPGSADTHADAGETVSNDPAGAGATSEAPIRAAVSVPAGGTAGPVTVLTGSAPATPPSGYALLGQEVRITAPAQTAASPLVLTFTLDASVLPAGVAPADVQVFRNGAVVADCSTSGPGASPDPCVHSRTALVGGDARIAVRTSEASTWWFGRATVPPYAFSGFFSPVDNLPTLNAVQAGRAVPVKFGLGGDRGLAVFADGHPKSQAVACDSSAPVDGVESTVTAGASSLGYDAATSTYTYVWKTDKAWAGTCRQLVLTFKDGTTRRAAFKLSK